MYRHSAFLCIWLVAISGASQAEECTPRFVPEAEFGTKVLGTKIPCPSLKPEEEQSCELNDAGIVYGVSDGLIVNKLVTANSYVGPLPFGLEWGTMLDKAVRKLDHVTQETRDVFLTDHNGTDPDGEFHMSTDLCFATRGGEPYALDFIFDNKSTLVRVRGQILYP